MAKTLFLISQSPNRAENLTTVLKLISSDDAVCFIQDGVYFANENFVPENLSSAISDIQGMGIPFYFLEPDLKARNITCDKEKVDYDGLLDLIEKYDNVFH
ncbi:MAG: hypothetical protein B5M53_07915 [Candidatus Cloacimonas sp. 4484_209]|nr:MAG: hypothetical protein B5M53_07915 [Candidatus Cloacimonas sp. 4484_209]